MNGAATGVVHLRQTDRDVGEKWQYSWREGDVSAPIDAAHVTQGANLLTDQ